ncbi:transglutaminase-like domain-containing protein [Nocardioides sp. DS6]|uniref:Transglutaminase-like domain-containing protein n=1 Tax=Nocardioides eburneus TaxID=3231482 RepID=A0ABV3SYC6_9ACTN
MSATVVPRGREAVDAAFLVVLSVLALLGLEPTFTGHQYLLVGVVGLLLGLACVRLAHWRRWPRVSALLLALAVFVVLGPVLCLREDGGPLPTGGALHGLLDAVLLGWKELLTTLPPVDGSGHLLVLPWLVGIAVGLLGGLLLGIGGGGADRIPEAARLGLPLLPPVLLLAAVILLGVRHPASLLLQGIAFAVIALVWITLRGLERTSVRSSRRVGTLRRTAFGVATLAVAAVVAVPASAALTDDTHRDVLRQRVVPPVDVAQFGSPLSAFRRYTQGRAGDPLNLHDTTLMVVKGAPTGTRIRFATLDRYDGTVWAASEEPARALPGVHANAFLHVSDVIDNPVRGRTVHARVTLGKGWSSVWLPTVGALQRLDFTGADRRRLAGDVRYDLETSTGLVPSGLEPGDSYDLTAVEPSDLLTRDETPGPDLDPSVQTASEFLQDVANSMSGDATDPMDRMLTIAAYLKAHGRYSDGVKADQRIYHAGHYQKRLGQDFLEQDLIVGNDEQYAAAMALLANQVGVPARVVLGAELPATGVVTGADVHAWVEVQVADGSWRTLPTDSFMSHRSPAELPPQRTENSRGSEAPPPAPVPPPSTLGGQADQGLKGKKDVDTDEGGGGLHVPRWVLIAVAIVALPVVLVLLFAALVLGAKAWRRARRRAAERPSARIVGAWRELVDHARDLGRAVAVDGPTRREQAVQLDHDEAAGLARVADSHVFGPLPPGEDAAASYWTAVDGARRDLSAGATRWQRVRAALSLVTFWRRWRHEPEPVLPTPRNIPEQELVPPG